MRMHIIVLLIMAVLFSPAALADTASAAEDPVLYYYPAGGEYYHLDQNCKLVNPKYLPLSDSFLYSELNDDPYRALKPCEVCVAPLRPGSENSPAETGETDPFRFAAFGEAMDAVSKEGESFCVSSDGSCVALIERDGHFFRAVTFFDDRAKELYAAYEDAWTPGSNQSDEEYNLLTEYIRSLPVEYTEELAVVPFTQEKLDAMAGKTIGEVMSEPWELGMQHYPDDAESGKDIIFPMVKGFCKYDLVINEPYEVYQERCAADHYEPVTEMSLENYLDLTVKCVKYSGIASTVNDLRYQADGTFNRDTELLSEGYDNDLMLEIADYLAAVWENGEPDRKGKEAIIVRLTEEHPEAADMIRQMVESFH